MMTDSWEEYSRPLIIQGNTNINLSELSFHACQNGYCQKNPRNNSVGKNMEKLEHLHSVGENEK